MNTVHLITTLGTSADPAVEPYTGFEGFTNITITLSDVWMTFILSVLLPVLTAIVTKRFASSTTKTLTLAVLSAVAAALTQLGGTFELGAFFTQTLTQFFIASGLHSTILKKYGVTGTNGVAAKVAPEVGVGKVPTYEDLPSEGDYKELIDMSRETDASSPQVIPLDDKDTEDDTPDYDEPDVNAPR